jgi:hypothetical protein
MRVAKDEIDVRLEIEGAVVRQRQNFGGASGYGRISGGIFHAFGRR